MDLDAPPMNSKPFKRDKPQLSVLIPPKADHSQDLSPRRQQKYRNSMKSPTTFNQPIAEASEHEPESPGSGTKRKMQHRVSCIPKFPIHNLKAVESLDRPVKSGRSRNGTELAAQASAKEIPREPDYQQDRLLKHFEDRMLKKQKESLRSSWRRTTQMAAFIGRMQTMQRGSQT